MPPRSKVGGLPQEVRDWLNEVLADNQFGGYEQLSELLAEKGFSISRSAMQRYGKSLERRLASIKASTEAARAIAKESADDGDELSGAVIRMVQTDMFNVLVDLQDADEADPAEAMKLRAKAAKAIAELARASVTQKKWMIQTREKAAAAADKVAKIAQTGGLSEATVDDIRRKILGIVPQ